MPGYIKHIKLYMAQQP